jgi:hypothetical protein
MSGKRGRASVAEIMTVPSATVLDRVERPRAPHDLSYEEIDVWAAVVNSLPAEWFTPETVPLLTQYCRHAVQARRIAEWIVEATKDPKELKIKDYDRLLKMQTRESAAMSSLAVKMRITQSATRNDRGNSKPPSAGKKPWET